MFPDRLAAHEILAEAKAHNPGPWANHSRFVAQAAEAIATTHPHFDPDRAYALGLLHDIGRRFGPNKDTHILHGYDYLLSLGFPAAARIALTHSPSLYETPFQLLSPWDGTAAELTRLQMLAREVELTEEDRLFQLCDALALPDGICPVEERLVDVSLRHGVTTADLDRWRTFLDAKAHFDRECGVNIYRLLPGFVERLLR